MSATAARRRPRDGMAWVAKRFDSVVGSGVELVRVGRGAAQVGGDVAAAPSAGRGCAEGGAHVPDEHGGMCITFCVSWANLP